MSTPVVTIFVRHRADCKFKGEEFYKQCRCRKHLRWSHNGTQYRQSAKSRSWEQAEKAKKRIEEAFDQNRTPEQAAAAALPEERKTLAQAIKMFLESKENQNVSKAILAAHNRDLARLEDFMAKKRRFFPAEVDLHDLESFRTSWKQYYKSSTSRQVAQTRLKEFLNYIFNAKMIDRVPVLRRINVEEPPTLPLTDDQYEKLLAAPSKATVYKQKTPHVQERVRAIILLQRHSGLSIRDASMLARDRILFDEGKQMYKVLTARQKTGTDVYVPIPTAIAGEILEVYKLNENREFLFWNGEGDPEKVAAEWNKRVNKVFRTAFPIPKDHPKYCKCHPRGSHQLRDTFAVNMLVNGMPLEEVSKMLGHSSIKTTEKHYSAWVQSRQDRVDALVMGIWQAQAAAAPS